MGATNSTLEEDKGLQLCRARKKFIKQALNGRCSLAAAHITYVEELKIIGTALRRFVELDSHSEPFIHPTRSTLTERSASFSSRSLGQHVDGNGHVSPSPSPTISTRFQSHHMKFRSPFSKKVEEKPSTPVTVSVITNMPPTTTPRSTEAREASYFETPSIPSETPPWDYFGLFHPIDDHFASEERRGLDNGPDHGLDHGSDHDSEFSDEIRHLNEEEELPELENAEEKISNVRTEESQESEDEFDEPSTATLVRSFKNLTTSMENIVNDDSPKQFSNTKPETKISASVNENEVKENKISGNLPIKSSESVILETKFVNGKKGNSPELSPLRATSLRFVHLEDVKITPMKESEEVEEKVVAPKDFFSSMKHIEQLFIKASDSGKEVPRMLEANKFHFRPVIPGREGGSITSLLLRSCFSCGEDPSEIQKEPQQNSVKYLTWHRTTSSRSASSRNLLGANSNIEDVEETSNNLFDSFCMVSGSHASTLDRLYAWEKKLYDEVKAGQILKSNFDQKCKLLRQQESRGENADKTRAVVKNLHSRIRVAIHRIDSISKKVEDIRDKELQPQLEELIEGLKRMWEIMLECHKLQFHIISISHAPGSTRVTLQSDTRRQVTIHLGNELNAFLSSFTKWIGAQKLYLESIDKWLFKCVYLPQNKSKRNKRMKPLLRRDMGPPIYMLCGAWLDIIEELPSKAVIDSVKDLATEVSHFLPRQEKNQGKTGNSHGDPNLLRDEASEDWIPALDRFRTSLAGFLGQLNNFAEASVEKFTELQKVMQERKTNYEQFKSQQL